MNPEFISFHRPSIGRAEIDEVVATLESGWLTTGPRTHQFEREFQSYVGAPGALAVNSGTAALHLALAALRIGPGDEVITTPLTFCATVNTIMHVGATPVLADIGPDGNIDPDSIERRITERTRAIVPVHIGGLPCKMDRIWDIARRRGLAVVEDAAHALGTHYRGRLIGAVPDGEPSSDAVAYSFYATKNITTGEGGMLTARDPSVLEAARILCLHGISKDAWDRYTARGSWSYQVVSCGFKYNMSDLQSAIGIHQLRRIEDFIACRKQYADMYTSAFTEMPELECPPDSTSARHCWHLYAVRLNLETLSAGRAEFIEQLRSRGVGASVHFIPIPLHPFFASDAALERNQCPAALELFPRLVSLPLYPSMTPEQVARVIDVVKDTIASCRKRNLVAVGRA